MICSNCGASLLDGAKFCVNCGNAVAETPAAETPVEEMSNDMQPTLVNDETSQQVQYSEPIPAPAPFPAQGINTQMPVAGAAMGAATAGMAAGAPMYNAMYQAQPVSNVKPVKKMSERYTKVLGVGGHLTTKGVCKSAMLSLKLTPDPFRQVVTATLANRATPGLISTTSLNPMS